MSKLLRSEINQLRERNEKFSRIAHDSQQELLSLQKKYKLLEADRNALVQQIRELKNHK